MKFSNIPLFLIVLSLIITGCTEKRDTSNKQPYIVTTTGMIADLVKNIAGDKYRVEGLMGPGVDPHLYKASQGDIGKLSEADIIFYNGLHLEGKMTEILQKMARKKKVFAISNGIPQNRLIALEGSSGAHDPHIWFDVSLWKESIPLIIDKLTKEFPNDAEIFKKNAHVYDLSLDYLHRWILDLVSTVPNEQRVLITAHDAFGYFGKAYNITVFGLQGISTVAEYGVNDVNKTVDLILNKKIRAVFVESSVPRRSIEAVVAGVQGKNQEIQIGGSLYSDAMGGPGSGADNYIGMVQTNVQTIVNALK